MTTLQAAVEYLNLGYSVIPLKPLEKRPIVKWSEYAERKPTTSELEEWFSDDTNNIAIITGPASGLVVVDIDDPKLLDDYLSRFPTGRVAVTPGGYHLYYRYLGSDIGNSVGKLATNIDVRGTMGYVLAPPSKTYGGYRWQSQGTPSNLPTDLRREILNALAAQRGSTHDTGPSQDANDLYRQVQLQGFTQHQHNQQVKDLARYLYRQGVTNEAAIYRLIEPLNEKDPTPLPDTELRDTIRSAARYERDRLSQQTHGQPAAQDKRIVEFDARPYMEVDQQFDDVFSRWLIDQWVPEKSILMIAAPPESYKTWLLLDAAISVALGKDASPFLGHFEMLNGGLPVLIVQQEDYMGQLMVRMRAIGDARGADIEYPVYTYPEQRPTGEVDAYGEPVTEPTGDQTVVFTTARGVMGKNIRIHTTSSLAFDDDASLDALEGKIKEHGIRLVVIDPLYMLDTAEDNFASVARKMSRIKAMRDAYDCTFIFAHHTRKSGGNGREAIFGSQLLNGAVEGVWLIEEVGDPEYRRIKRYGKAFQGHQQPLRARFEINTSELYDPIDDEGPDAPIIPYRVEVEPDSSDEVSLDDLEEEALAIITQKGQARPADIYGDDKHLKSKVDRALKKLVAAGKVIKTGGERGYYVLKSEKASQI